jgi:hypothetical protein
MLYYYWYFRKSALFEKSADLRKYKRTFPMKNDNLHSDKLKKVFSKQPFFRTNELRDFYRSQEKELSENTFRRVLYSLEKEGLILKVDKGIYVLGDQQTQSLSKKKFLPAISPEVRELNTSLKRTFPYTMFLIWETKVLHDFMTHQPGLSQTIIETEKETVESIFNYLSTQYAGKVFLDPNRETFERYILQSSEIIIILPMVTESPSQKIDGILCPKLEKILVDVFTDDEKFFIYQGQELVNIFEAAFKTYRLSEKTLFRYARRRKVSKKIKNFIDQKANVTLIQHRSIKP